MLKSIKNRRDGRHGAFAANGMSIFYPQKIFHRITDITPEKLKEMGIHGLMIDVDNTLSTHGGQVPIDGLKDWIREMHKGGIRLIILSNARHSRVEPFAKKIGLSFISLAAKPLPFGYLSAVGALGIPRKQTAIVGDQLFTDILGGHLAGVGTLLVRPILPEDKKSFKIRRKYENIILRKHGYTDEKE